MNDDLAIRKMQKIDAEIKSGKMKVFSEADVGKKCGFGIAKGAKPFKRELFERTLQAE